MEHAQVAEAMDDLGLKLTRWQRVIEIGGDKTSSKAYKNLSNCYFSLGDFERAEAVVRKGMALHPDDLYLAERLCKISRAQGFTKRSIAQCEELLEKFPEANHVSTYCRMSEVLRGEGLIDRAEAVLDEGISRYPDDWRLKAALARITAGVRTLPANPEVPSTDFTAHLFGDTVEPFGRGTISLPITISPNDANRHILTMLDFAEHVAPLREAHEAEKVDIFGTWGATEGFAHNLARQMAELYNKPLVAIEYGFISSLGLAINGSPQHSIIVCPDSIYFDSTRPSFLETKLNSSGYSLTDKQHARALDCIEKITRHRVTKYNHAPQIDLTHRFPPNGRKRILLVDQRFGDNSVDKGLGGEASFERMMEAALALHDHEILVKLHPDAISGGQASYLGRLVPNPCPENISIIDFDVNPYCLFVVVDQVFVCTSQLGFEALMAGKEVHCFGMPFYAGWGLTTDRMVIPRRRQKRSLCEVFHLFYIEHSRYFSPNGGVVDIENLIEYLIEANAAVRHLAPPSETLVADESPALPTIDTTGQTLQILIILPSGRWGATGRYVQHLACSLIRQDCSVMVLSEDKKTFSENGVFWLPLEFDGLRLAATVRQAIVEFAPHIIYENGVRSRAQRATLEAMMLTDARLAMQSEDDEVQVFGSHHGEQATVALTLLDEPRLYIEDIMRFIHTNNWRHSLSVLLDPAFDRWVEPVMRILCYRLASLHTAIWYPFAERLEREYKVPTLVVPPVAAKADFERLPLSREERAVILARHGIEEDSIVLFIGGSLYSFSNEYALFLDALNLTCVESRRKIALVVALGRSSLPVSRMARERLRPEITFADIGQARDDVYMEMLKACDVVCSPGVPDTFNRFRLPSRLVKAMAMAKPVLTCRCGFGESLENGVNAFLTEDNDPVVWAETIAMCLDEAKRAVVGSQGQAFARQHFDCDRVAKDLKNSFRMLLDAPPRSLVDGICQDTKNPLMLGHVNSRKLAGIKLRDRYHSSMQDAIHAVASHDNRLDTVVHIGAGRCAEFDDYCRLGAGLVALVEASPVLAAGLRELENTNGSVIVKHAAVCATRGTQQAFVVKAVRTTAVETEEYFLLRPARLLREKTGLRIIREEFVTTCTIQDVCEDISLNGTRNLLILELQGLEAQVLRETPTKLLKKFHWIATRVSEEPLCENAATRAQLEEALTSAGFESILAAADFSEPTVCILFRRKVSH